MVLNAGRLFSAIFTLTSFSHTASSVVILPLRVSAHGLEVVWLQVGYRLAYRRASSQSLARFFRVVLVSHGLSVNSIVSASLRTRLVENLRFLIEYPRVVRVFLQVFKELDAVLNL